MTGPVRTEYTDPQTGTTPNEVPRGGAFFFLRVHTAMFRKSF